MKFTLVTSFYNGENFIELLYEKIKSQTYKNWEWVVTDDFSNDNGRQKLIDISNNDRRVKYVELSKKKEMFVSKTRSLSVLVFLIRKIISLTIKYISKITFKAEKPPKIYPGIPKRSINIYSKISKAKIINGLRPRK